MKKVRIFMVVLSLIQGLNYALIGVFVRALEAGTISGSFFGGFEALIGLTVIVNVVITYQYAEEPVVTPECGGWAHFFFTFSFLLCWRFCQSHHQGQQQQTAC